MRYSKQREVINNIVKATDIHPSAEQVYFEAKKIIPGISLGTVYRNLKLLADTGAVKTVETSDLKLRFDGNTASHPHFVCNSCGRIIDISVGDCDFNQLTGHGYTIEAHEIVIYGACPSCASQHNTKKIKKGDISL